MPRRSPGEVLFRARGAMANPEMWTFTGPPRDFEDYWWYNDRMRITILHGDTLDEYDRDQPMELVISI